MKKRILLITLLLTLTFTLTGCRLGLHPHTNAGPTIYRTLTKQNFNEIDANVSLLDFKLKPSDTSKVVFHGGKKLTPQVKVKNGKLIIREKHHFLITINDNQENLLTIYLPRQQLKRIAIDTSDGDITSNGKIAANKLDLSSDDGDITADFLQVNKGSVSSDDGDLQINRLRSTAGFKADSDDGDITINNSNATGFDLSSDDGDVTCRGHNYDDDAGGSYQHHRRSKNVLIAHSDDGDVEVN
ncbi:MULTISPECIES: DUF4097 family beta strand repeat-containing protein [Lactobacillus]|uniref:DUF4097 domain-containing protein n=1 Tax=Lactobacillus xujianguonis TaxID=2495899 RepID=A0A437SX23_9LACO|nr:MULTISPECIES: DUF4097 family beta strand repeat-containing protein [Lactobacillus]RVU71461.1 hypothetical protein EJK17_01810 [Lactobacillus xujianguonis]RVU73684.1 hypothetical protein EJK20_06860 [Lactobacillus xujianguonis]